MYAVEERKLGELSFRNSLQPVDENFQSNPERYKDLMNFTY